MVPLPSDGGACELHRRACPTLRWGAGVSESPTQPLVAVHFSREQGGWETRTVSTCSRWATGASASERSVVGPQQRVLHVILRVDVQHSLFKKNLGTYYMLGTQYASKFGKQQWPQWPFHSKWTVARQAPLSMGFSRQEYWSGLPFTSLGDLPNEGIEPWCPALQADSLPSELQGRSNPKERHCQRVFKLPHNGTRFTR